MIIRIIISAKSQTDREGGNLRFLIRSLARYALVGVVIAAITGHTTAGSAMAHDIGRFFAHTANAVAPAAVKPAPAGVQIGFSPGNAESLVIQTIDGAKDSIYAAAYSFTSAPIASALVRAARRGVTVKVVMDKSQRTERYSSARFLANERVPVRINARYAIMHNKFLVVDGQTVETGSFNYTRSAQARNAENVMVLRGEPAVARAYMAEWNRLWSESSVYAPRY
jgi:phosphatidylserine/phosphatidylglycerophosphate/cardiolipin synthase-like enzyme